VQPLAKLHREPAAALALVGLISKDRRDRAGVRQDGRAVQRRVRRG
jgi:hypothetical protein